jgi:hypothetical protein
MTLTYLVVSFLYCSTLGPVSECFAFSRCFLKTLSSLNRIESILSGSDFVEKKKLFEDYFDSLNSSTKKSNFLFRKL